MLAHKLFWESSGPSLSTVESFTTSGCIPTYFDKVTLLMHMDGEEGSREFVDSSNYQHSISATGTPFITEAKGDPYYNSVELLLSMDGYAGSTTFKDSSKNNHTISVSGTPSISSTSGYAGGQSAYFDGSGDYLTLPSSVFDFGTEDWTIEFWINVLTNSNTYPYTMGSSRYNSGSGFYLTISGSATGWGGTGAMSFNGASTLVNRASVGSGDVVIRNAGWKHIAITRNGVETRMFVDGVMTSLHIASGVANYGVQAARIMTTGEVPASTSLLAALNERCYLDELRVTKGVARYTADFPLPKTPYAKAVENMPVKFLSLIHI